MSVVADVPVFVCAIGHMIMSCPAEPIGVPGRARAPFPCARLAQATALQAAARAAPAGGGDLWSWGPVPAHAQPRRPARAHASPLPHHALHFSARGYVRSFGGGFALCWGAIGAGERPGYATSTGLVLDV